jgi:hypothetical protein
MEAEIVGPRRTDYRRPRRGCPATAIHLEFVYKIAYLD